MSKIAGYIDFKSVISFLEEVQDQKLIQRPYKVNKMNKPLVLDLDLNSYCKRSQIKKNSFCIGIKLYILSFSFLPTLLNENEHQPTL